MTIQFTKKELINITEDLIQNDIEEFRKRNNLKKDGRDWKLQHAKKDLLSSKLILTKIHHRPLDFRYTYYTGKTKGFQAYPRKEVSHNIIGRDNYGLINLRQNYTEEKYVILVTNTMIEKGSLVCGNYFINPLYLYPDTYAQQTLNHETEETADAPQGRISNLNKEIVHQIAENLGLEFVPDHEILKKVQRDKYFSPLDLLDYIYAVLNSPNYRETYKEFLKIDFPRVPYPKDSETFWQLVKLGGEIRQLHLLESSQLDNYITSYPVSGSNEITRKMTKSSIGFELTNEETQTGKVWINDDQYFDNVPLVAWEFYIGGYQPAQKWLKDRKMRTLDFEDIIHYQKMIVALTETDRLMKEIDKIEFLEKEKSPV